MDKLLIILFIFFAYTCVSAQEISNMSIKEKTLKDANDSKLNTSFPAAFPHETNLLKDSMSMNVPQVNRLADSLSFPYLEMINTSIIHQWRNVTLYGIGNGVNMIGLMKKQNAEVGVMYSHDKMSFSIGLMANVYNFNLMSAKYGFTIQNQFGINGRFSYDFNGSVSATVYGRYITNPFYHSMASFPYITTSSFGGFITWNNEKYGIDLGVNNYYDAFSNKWRTDPIVRPTYKIGKVKMSIDVGPLMKEGVLRLINKRKVDGPIIMPSK